MKIIGTDNFARETVADRSVAENIKSEQEAKVMCEALNTKFCTGDYSPTFYKVVEDDYRLSKGMEDFR